MLALERRWLTRAVAPASSPSMRLVANGGIHIGAIRSVQEILIALRRALRVGDLDLAILGAPFVAAMSATGLVFRIPWL